MRVTQHFQVKEFFTDGIPSRVENLNEKDRKRIRGGDYPAEPHLFRIFLLSKTILEPVRQQWKSGMRITSGIRTAATYKRFAKSGISHARPSRSDHADHTLNPWSTGAADIIPSNGDVDGLMRLMVQMHDSGMLVGQLIFERNLSGAEWVHVSNNQDVFFRVAGDTMRDVRSTHSPGIFQIVSQDGKNQTGIWR